MAPSKSCLLFCCLVMLLQMMLPPVSLAKLYTWTDRNGIVRRTYYPPPADQVQREAPVPEAAPVQQSVTDNTVELYVTSWCPYCKKAISYFNERGVAITVYDIETDSAAAQRKEQLDGRGGVPFAIVNGARIRGFAPEQYAQALR